MRFIWFLSFCAALLGCQTTAWNFVPANGPPGSLAHSLCTSVDGRLLVFGGIDEETGSPLNSDLFLYDPGAHQWQQIDNNFIIPPRNLAALATLDHKLYVFGGETAQQPATADLYAYDLEQHTWNTLPQAEGLSTRKQASFTTVGKELILFGGKGPTPIINWGIYAPGPQQWSIHRTNKDARVSHIALAISDTELLIWGGFIGSDRVNHGFIINTKNQDIEDLAPSPLLSARANARALKIDDQVYIWGGATADDNANSGAVLNLKNKTWHKLPPIPDPRFQQLKSAEIAAWDNRGFLLIGGRFGSQAFNNQLWFFDIHRNQWNLLPIEPYPPGRIAHCVASLDSHTIAVFGGIGYRPETQILTHFGGIWILKRTF